MTLSAINTLIVEIFLLETYQKYKQSTQYCSYKSFVPEFLHGRYEKIWGDWEEKAVLHEEVMLIPRTSHTGTNIVCHYSSDDYTNESIFDSTRLTARPSAI